MPNANWGTTGLLSTTLEKLMPSFQQQIFTSKVLLWILSNANQVKNAPGGISIVEPILYDPAPNVGSYADYDVFTTDPNTGLSAAEFPWRQFYGLFHISGIELAMNSGEQAIINLAQARLDQLKLSMSEAINLMLYLDGTGNGGKDFLGLDVIVEENRVLGGIDSNAAGSEYWDATVFAGSGTDATLVADMRTAYNTASEGNDHPTNGLTTQKVFEVYEEQLVDQARYTDMAMADGGFQNLLFKGIPIAFDRAAEQSPHADPLWFLNTKYLTLRKLAETWFKPSDMLQPTNQDAFYKNILCYGNLTTNFPARQAVVKAAVTA